MRLLLSQTQVLSFIETRFDLVGMLEHVTARCQRLRFRRMQDAELFVSPTKSSCWAKDEPTDRALLVFWPTYIIQSSTRVFWVLALQRPVSQVGVRNWCPLPVAIPSEENWRIWTIENWLAIIDSRSMQKALGICLAEDFADAWCQKVCHGLCAALLFKRHLKTRGQTPSLRESFKLWQLSSNMSSIWNEYKQELWVPSPTMQHLSKTVLDDCEFPGLILFLLFFIVFAVHLPIQKPTNQETTIQKPRLRN